MSDIVETAQPAAEVAGGQAIDSDVEEILAPVETAAPQVEEKPLSLDQVLSRKYDEMHAPPKAPPAPEAKPAQSDPAQRPASEPVAQSSAIAPPVSWSAEKLPLFATMRPEAQAYVAERDREATQQISRMGSELKAFEPVREVYQALNQWGVPRGREAEVVQSWARAQATLDKNPEDGLRWLAQSYGVDLAKLAGQPAQAAAAQPLDDLFKDPRVDGLLKEIEAHKQYIQKLGGHVQQREQVEQQRMEAEAERQRASLQKEIDEFAKDKPLFRDIESEITHEVALLKAKEPGLSVKELIAKGYERAVYANPQTRERVLSEARKAEADKAQKEAAAKQAQAKKLAAMNVRTGASASTPTFDGKWDANLSDLYDQITSRA
jgi:hypothetical protein